MFSYSMLAAVDSFSTSTRGPHRQSSNEEQESSFVKNLQAHELVIGEGSCLFRLCDAYVSSPPALVISRDEERFCKITEECETLGEMFAGKSPHLLGPLERRVPRCFPR